MAVDRVPPALVLLPLLAMVGFLGARAAAEWPRVGYPACLLGVFSWMLAAGLFRSGVTWAREWDRLRNAGDLATDPGLSPVLGMALAILLGGSFLAVLFLHLETVWRTLSTVRLAVVTLSFVGVCSVGGTMIVQRGNAGQGPEEDKTFVEKFMKGQGGIPVNARFMVSPPKVELAAVERENLEKFRAAFGTGVAQQRERAVLEFRAREAKATAIDRHVDARREHLLGLFGRCEALGLTDIFRSWWFNSLLVLLVVQVSAVMTKRYPWGWGQAGWVATHSGVIVVLVGCVISDGFLRDGQLVLEPGQGSEQFTDFTVHDPRGGPADRDLGFRVRMLGTDQTFFHELAFYLPGTAMGPGMLSHREQLRPGRRFEVTDPGSGSRYAVRILEVHERARRTESLVSAAGKGRDDALPAIHLEYLREGGDRPMGEKWLLADPRSRIPLPDGEIHYVVAKDAAEVERLTGPAAFAEAGRYGTLVVRLPGGGPPLEVKGETGAEGSAAAGDGTHWTVRVTRFFANHRVEQASSPEDPRELPLNPALEFEVRRGEEAAAPALVYANPRLQEMWESMQKNPEGGMKTRYGKGAAEACGFEFRYEAPFQALVVEAPGVPRKMALLEKGKEPRLLDFASPGTTVPLGRLGVAVRLKAALADAVPESRIEPLGTQSDEEYLAEALRTLERKFEVDLDGDGKVDSRIPEIPVSAARIEIVETPKGGTPGAPRAEWLVADPFAEQPDVVRSPDGNLVLLLEETNNASMYRSALQVEALKEGKDGMPVALLRHVVRVNHPLAWGGYAFYQSSVMPGEGGQVGGAIFRVKYDRGIPIVYSGFIVLVGGVLAMLWLTPMLRGRRPAAAGGEGAKSGPPA